MQTKNQQTWWWEEIHESELVFIRRRKMFVKDTAFSLEKRTGLLAGPFFVHFASKGGRPMFDHYGVPYDYKEGDYEGDDDWDWW